MMIRSGRSTIWITVVAITCMALLAGGPDVSAQVPEKLSLQGRLLDGSGDPVADGFYSLTVSLYDQASGGTSLWTTTQTVETEAGVYDAVLGESPPLALAFDAPYWLGISVAGEPELSPRLELLSSPYALMARSIEDGAITSTKLADDTVVRSLNGLTDDVVLSAGENVTISAAQDTIFISASGGGGSGSHNTLDEAYDEGGSGLGRQITVDNGAVDLDGATAGFGDVLTVTHGSGAGHAVGASIDGTGFGYALHATVEMTATGRGLNVDQLNSNNPEDAVTVANVGLGAGISAMNSHASSTRAAILGIAGNPGPGVKGLAGDTPQLGNAMHAGVAGESRDREGVSGYSDLADGVWGKSDAESGVSGRTQAVGTFYDGSPYALSAGVLGRSAIETTADNFGVVGMGNGYGVGVLGLGGNDLGHGVVGIANTPQMGATSAGVRGVTKEQSMTHWALGDLTDKQEVGVLGQADQFVAVWGESQEAFGVVGTMGGTESYGQLPTEGSGLYGKSFVEEANGVQGVSISPEPDDAAVVAEGNGAVGPGDPRAAALEIRNGAVRVSGEERPAGIVQAVFPDTPLYTCIDTHSHMIGMYGDGLIVNDLVVPESIVLLTIEVNSAEGGVLTGPYPEFTVELRGKDPGRLHYRVSFYGFPFPDDCWYNLPSLKIHYMIINPFPAGSQ